ncbi:MAG: hypothetical protein AB8D52_03555 [Gammaproteobacteria bacterium]
MKFNNKKFIFCALTLILSSCSQSDVEYFPLAAGKSWQYRVVIHDMDLEKKYKQFYINEPPVEIDGNKVFPKKINDGTQYYFEHSDQGIRRVGAKRKLDINTTLEKKNYFVIKYPLEVGTSWEQESITAVLEVVIAPFRRHYALHTPVKMKYTIDSLDQKVKVAAGQFENCLKVVGVGTSLSVEAEKTIGTVDVTVESSDWYCPNIGLVKSQRKERTTSTVLVKGDFLMELETFSEG